MRYIILILISLCFTSQLLYADTVTLMDGTNFEAVAEFREGVYYIDGMVFQKSEIKYIEKKKLSKNAISEKKNWFEKLLYRFGWRTDYEKMKEADLTAYNERIARDDVARVQLEKSLSLKRQKEIQKAKSINADTLNRARQAKAKQKREEARKKKMTKPSTIGKTIRTDKFNKITPRKCEPDYMGRIKCSIPD